MQSAAAVAMMPLLIFFCCVHRSSDSVLFSGPGKRQPPKLPLSIGRSGPHIIHGSLCPHESTPQTATRSVQSFLQGSRTLPTDIHTDRPRYSVCNNRPHQATATMYVSVPIQHDMLCSTDVLRVHSSVWNIGDRASCIILAMCALIKRKEEYLI